MTAPHDTTTLTQGESNTGRILIVGGSAEMRASLCASIRRHHNRCTHVSEFVAGQSALAQSTYDLVLVSENLPDGSGIDLLRHTREVAPTTKTILFTDSGSATVTIEAIRSGAVDVIPLPAEHTEFLDRIKSALDSSRRDRERDNRVRRLQRICRELNSAREEISGQVDSLCNELLDAYQELSNQIDDVAMATEFRTLIRQELDVEEVLRTSLEYLLTKTGPTNAAVFLPDPDHNYSLGAYVNYDCPRESIDSVLSHLCHAICPQMAKEEDIVAFHDAAEFADWVGIDDHFFADSTVVALSCHHNDECLAVIVLFRSSADAFPDELAGTLDTLRQIFAEQLSRLIDIHHRSAPSWPKDAYEDDDDDFDLEDDDYGLAA